jgi:Rrf2 family protein
MFSKACEYALRATIYIAQSGTEVNKLGVEAIAAGIDAPRSFTAKILQQLNRGQVISSAKGPQGGFYISPELQQQPVWNVLVAMQESERLTNCVMGLNQCSDHRPCPMHRQYKLIKQQLVDLFKQRKIIDIASEMTKDEIFIRNERR